MKKADYRPLGRGGEKGRAEEGRDGGENYGHLQFEISEYIAWLTTKEPVIGEAPDSGWSGH